MSLVGYRLLMIRHAECDANAQGLICGVTDSPLSGEGLASLSKLSTNRLDSRWVVFSSTLLRAADSAKSLFPGEQIIYMDEFKEIDYGCLEMKPKNLFSEQFSEFGKCWSEFTVESPEKYLSIAWSLLSLNENNRVVITHGGFINIVLHAILGIDIKKFPTFVIDNLHGVLLTASGQGGRWLVEALNIGPERWKLELA